MFDVYHSVGPNVDVHLFGEAAAQGAALGKAIPSPVTSAITGAEQGYAYGQEVEARSQENQIRQNQIDQEPVANEQQAAQLKNEQAIAQINSLKADVDKQDHDLAIQETQAQLTEQKTKLEQANSLLTKTNDFNTQFQNADPQKQASLVLSGKYDDVLAANKGLFTTALSSVYSNPNNGVDSATRDSIGQILKVKGAKDYYEKLAEQNLPKFLESKNELISSPLTNALTASGKLDVPLEEYPKSVQFEAAGRYQTNPSTGAVLKNADGSWMLNPTASLDAESRDKYDVFSKNGDLLYSGKNDFAGITVKGKEAYDHYQTQLTIQNGTQTQRSIQQITKPPSSAVQKPTALNVPTLGNESPQAQPRFEPTEDPIASALKQKLNLKEPELAAVQAPLSNLKTQLNMYANSASYRKSPDAIQQMSSTVTSMAKSISDAQFESNPSIKNSYTPADVVAYNDALRSKLRTVKFRGSPLVSILRGEEPATDDPIFSAFQVETPQDLYFVSRQSNLEGSINEVMQGLLQNRQQKAEQPVNSVISKNRNNSFLSKVASGNQ